MWMDEDNSGTIDIEEIRKEVDYSEYLGPDWKMTYEGHSCVICNH